MSRPRKPCPYLPGRDGAGNMVYPHPRSLTRVVQASRRAFSTHSLSKHGVQAPRKTCFIARLVGRLHCPVCSARNSGCRFKPLDAATPAHSAAMDLLLREATSPLGDRGSIRAVFANSRLRVMPMAGNGGYGYIRVRRDELRKPGFARGPDRILPTWRGRFFSPPICACCLTMCRIDGLKHGLSFYETGPRQNRPRHHVILDH